MLLIACSLSLLAIVAGMMLLAQTKKENLGNLFKYVSWFVVIMGFLCIVCIGCRCAMRCCMRGERECKMNVMMMRGDDDGCMMGGHMGGYGMMGCHRGMMGGCGMMMGGGCRMMGECRGHMGCEDGMEECHEGMGSCHEGMGSCHEGMGECKEGMKECHDGNGEMGEGSCPMHGGMMNKKDSVKKK